MSENASFNTQLQTYIGSTPQTSAKTLDCTGIGDFRSGAVFRYIAGMVLDGVAQPDYYLDYYMAGVAA